MNKNLFKDLLIEVGTEELPPKSLKNLSESFKDQINQGLEALQISHGEVIAYASPRRLVVYIKNLASRGEDRKIEKKGPLKAAALNAAGEPTPAALGFAKTCGVSFSELTWVQGEKGEYLQYQGIEPGANIQSILPELIQKALGALPIPKMMRWGDYPFGFVRPVQWLVLLYGEEVIAANLMGVTSDRVTLGHRIHHPAPVSLNRAEDYLAALKKAFVLVDPKERSEKILWNMNQLAEKHQATIIFDAELLEEVSAIVEWPVALVCHFEEKFLNVPREALISAMQGHQKCFALEDKKSGRLLPLFMAIANLESQNPQVVIAGNERVMRARLSDAAFFYEKDLKNKFSDLLPRLETLTFQAKLGSVGDKVRRLIQLIQQIGGDKNALRAAELSKADLMSEMVNEFPELQGIMGEYYARHQGESEFVAKALFEQYLPRFSGDKLPGSSSGKILALADRLDTLSGIFAIGLKPTGSKDPFALRRAMIGVIRLLTEGEMDFDLWALLDFALKPYETLLPKADKKAILGDLKSFALDRLKSFWLDEKKYDLVWVDAIIAKIIALDVANLKDAEQRLQALIAFGKLKEAESLLAANKRVGNLLKKNQISGDAALIQTHLFQESAEKDLFAQIQEIKPDLAKLLASNHYENYLKKLAVLRPVLDAFFESVMVMADDLAIRNNRLALLATVYELFGVIAVLSG